MLKLGLDLSLSSIRPQGVWSPDDEASLVAWYKNGAGITLNGSDVSQWADSSSNSRNMVQATATEQPSYSGGTLTFVSADSNSLQTTSQMSLTGDFTLGLRMNTSTTNGAFIGDNTSANEYFKYSASNKISFKIGGSVTTHVFKDSGSFGDNSIVITRASNVITLYVDGVAQTTNTPTLAGTFLVDVIGIRRTDLNGYDGTMKEVQIYSSSNATLITNVSNRLATL